jgi:hypothetical protein
VVAHRSGERHHRRHLHCGRRGGGARDHCFAHVHYAGRAVYGNEKREASLWEDAADVC